VARTSISVDALAAAARLLHANSKRYNKYNKVSWPDSHGQPSHGRVLNCTAKSDRAEREARPSTSAVPQHHREAGFFAPFCSLALGRIRRSFLSGLSEPLARTHGWRGRSGSTQRHFRLPATPLGIILTHL
jgi:hypothetical protein